MNMFSQNEIILMIGVVSALLICITILTILDIKEYLKEKKGLIKEEITSKEEYKEKEEVIVPTEVEITEDKHDEVLVNNKTDNASDLFFEEMEDEKFDVKENNVSIIEKEIVANVDESKKEKKVLEIFEDIDEIENNLPNKKDDITNFEMEQERTAIISLDELMKKSNELYDSNEFIQYDDGNEPISIDEVIKMFNKEENVSSVKEMPKVYEEVVEEKIEPYSKKETIPFISSVYGIEKENNALEFENTATYEKLDRQNHNDFIAKLREMNENK